MNDLFKWSKLKKENIAAAENLLRENEADYVSACSRYISRDAASDPVWILRSKSGGIAALIINSRSVLMPVFCKKEVPSPDFMGSFLAKKFIHSIQGLACEVEFLQEALCRKGMKIKDIIDYNLMSLDINPLKKNSNKCSSNLELCVPSITDLEALVPLQAGYEQEEVLPKGSVFNPASSRLNAANIIKTGKILAARLDGRFVGKINVNAVSFTRFQVGGVYVLPEYRGQGIAGKMTQEFVNSLINQGKGVTLFVKKANIAAIRLYSSLGFTVRTDYRITYY